jgi:hypothetical protein
MKIIARAAFALQAPQQLDDDRLYRDIQRRGDFIAYKKVWPNHEGTGYRDALALSS